ITGAGIKPLQLERPVSRVNHSQTGLDLEAIGQAKPQPISTTNFKNPSCENWKFSNTYGYPDVMGGHVRFPKGDTRSQAFRSKNCCIYKDMGIPYFPGLAKGGERPEMP